MEEAEPLDTRGKPKFPPLPDVSLRQSQGEGRRPLLHRAFVPPPVLNRRARASDRSPLPPPRRAASTVFFHPLLLPHALGPKSRHQNSREDMSAAAAAAAGEGE